MKINVYIGVIGSGKNFTSNKECNISIAFADKLREDVWKLLNWTPKTDFDYNFFKSDQLISYSEIRELGIELCLGRNFMINYANLRKHENPNYFIDALITELNTISKNCNSIIGISDCRFENEIKELINFANLNKIKITFIHCNYKSTRYDNTSDSESEKLAQLFCDKEYSKKEFDNIIKNLYK